RNKLGTLFKSSDPQFKSLNASLNKKTQETLSKDIEKADTEWEFKLLKIKLDGYQSDKLFPTGKFFKELTERANTYLDEKIKNADTTGKSKFLSEEIKE